MTKKKTIEETVDVKTDVEDVKTDVEEVNDVELTDRQRTLKWELERLLVIYGVEDFEKCLKFVFKS